MEFLMMLLENVPFLFRVHLLHLLTKGQMIIPKDLEAIIEPLEPFKHGHAALFPKHTGNLCFLRPHRVFFLLVIGVEL